MRIACPLLLCLLSVIASGQDSIFLRVHFLYGSKPGKKYRETEAKWFGGKLGGHVGVGLNDDSIINFLPNGKFHWFARSKEKGSRFAVHDRSSFYSILGGNAATSKLLVIEIPVTVEQRILFDSIVTVYMKQVPYDYALFGMRCGAAAYDMLARTGIVRKMGYRRTAMTIFYPRRLRKRLIKQANRNGWTIQRQDGSPTRKWEQD